MLNDQPLGGADALMDVLSTLARTVDDRAGASADSSYTARLLEGGPLKIAKKIIEEGGELALALTAEDDAAVRAETADLLYHVLVGLRARGVSLDEVADTLAARQNLSGLEEKASRKTD